MKNVNGTKLLSVAILVSTLCGVFIPLTYADPGIEVEYKYDDNSDNGVHGHPGMGVHFSTTETLLLSIKFYLIWVDAPVTGDFKWQVMEWDTSTGKPGAVMANGDTSTTSDGWHEVSVGIVIVPTEFFVALIWDDYPGIGVDSSGPKTRSYARLPDWELLDTHYMIRAVMRPYTIEDIMGELQDTDHGLEEIKDEVKSVEEKLDDETLFTDDNEISDLLTEIKDAISAAQSAVMTAITSARNALIDLLGDLRTALTQEIDENEAKLDEIEHKLDVVDVEIVPGHKDNIGSLPSLSASKRKAFFIMTSFAGVRIDYDSISISVDDKTLVASMYSITKLTTGVYKLTINKNAVPKSPNIHALIVDVEAGIYKGSGISAIEH